ncbi:MAG: hypothetical protein J4G09_11425 [Proteobacteria bacterium]|nr:hypothetical protein [Pseudomonadota bacterium]
MAALRVGDALPERRHSPDSVQLFLYNATLWNAHRIHYDRPYATSTEGYPELLVPGPLMGDWLAQCVDDWLGDAGSLVGLEYSNRQPAFAGEALAAGGAVESIDAESREVTVSLFLRNESGADVTPGKAVVRLAG